MPQAAQVRWALAPEEYRAKPLCRPNPAPDWDQNRSRRSSMTIGSWSAGGDSAPQSPLLPFSWPRHWSSHSSMGIPGMPTATRSGDTWCCCHSFCGAALSSAAQGFGTLGFTYARLSRYQTVQSGEALPVPGVNLNKRGNTALLVDFRSPQGGICISRGCKPAVEQSLLPLRVGLSRRHSVSRGRESERPYHTAMCRTSFRLQRCNA